MKKYILAGALTLAVCASQAGAQLQYDPFFALPGKAGTMGVDVGLANTDLSGIGDASDVFAMGKYSLNDKLELGARATLGFLTEGADTFRHLQVGAKYSIGGNCALAANLMAPVGEMDDPGLALAYMHTMAVAGISTNAVLQANLLKGYADKGVGLNLFLEPYKAFGSKMVGYLDLYILTNTDDIGGNYLAINLGPNVDYKLNDKMTINVGLGLGLAGDAKQADPGISATLIYLCAK